MAVHYSKKLVTAIKAHGLRLVTIDCGSGIRYQGGCSPAEHMDLIQLVDMLTRSTYPRSEGPNDLQIPEPPAAEVVSALPFRTVADVLHEEAAKATAAANGAPSAKQRRTAKRRKTTKYR